MAFETDNERRMRFLSEVHVGVLSIAQEGRGPFSTPIWYDYEPGGEVVFTVEGYSKKNRLVEVGTKVSFLVQRETWPYEYVSIEGTVVEKIARQPEDVARFAHRYLGEETGAAYVEHSRRRVAEGGSLVKVRPEHWIGSEFSSIAKDLADEIAAKR